MTAVLRYLLRKFYLFCALALITIAVLVQSGRSFSPFVSDYRAEVVAYLSQQLNAQVTLGALNMEWDGLKPVLEIDQLSIESPGDLPILAVGQARVRLDLLRSLWNWQLVWGVINLQQTELVFEQTAQGHWRIPGLPQSGQKSSEAVQLDTLVDTLLLANTIEFQHTHLRFHFADGHHIALDSPSLRLENHLDFHRLSLAIDIEGQEEAVTLVIEGKGDPRDQARFQARGFLSLANFPTSEPLAAATAALLGNVSETRLRSAGALNTRLWFNTRENNEGIDLTGELELQTLLVPLLGRQYQLDSFSTGIKGYWLRSGAWNLGLPGLNAELEEAQIESVNLAISADSYQAPLQIQLDQLHVPAGVGVLKATGVLTEGMESALATLNPKGMLEHIRVTLPLNNPRGWELEARARQLAVDAWRGVPKLTGVDGYIKANQQGGSVNIESRNGFSMHYQPTYAEAMHYQQATGQVAWHLRPDEHRIYVNSGALRFQGEQEEATGHLWLSLPWRQAGEVDLFLHIGARNLNASLYSKYVPAIVPDSLTQWLAKSIGANNSGQVKEIGFLFRGTLNTPLAAARSYQLYLDVEGAELDYHPDWPALRNMQGRLLIDDNNIEAWVDHARLFSSEVLPTRISSRPNPEGEGALLTVKGRVQGPADDGLRVLRESGLRQYVNQHLDSWKLQGKLATALDLAVPLAPGAPGAAQQIDFSLEASTLEMRNHQLTLNELQGQVFYSSEQGFSSQNLQARLFDQPLTATLATQQDEGVTPHTHLGLTGTLEVERLAQWSKRPELLFLDGVLSYQTDIEFIHQPKADAGDADPDRTLARVSLVTNLVGTQVNLPAPYGKPAEAERNLRVELKLQEERASVFFDYRDDQRILAQSRMLFDRPQERLLKINLALGREAYLPIAPQFVVSGHLPELRVDAWRAVELQYLQHRARVGAPLDEPFSTDADAGTAPIPGTFAGLPVYLDLVLGSHELGPLLLKNLALKAWQQDAGWHLEFANPLLTGSLQMPADKTRPMSVNVRELHLNRSLFDRDEATSSDPAAELGAALTEETLQFHPRDLPHADVTVAALFVDNNNYGNWSLQVRPDRRGVLFDDIRGNIRGVTVSGIQAQGENAPRRENSAGAQIYWVIDEQGPRTRFIGSLTAENMADVMQAWQQPDIVESSQASYQVDLTWPGAPGEFALVNLEGDVSLLLEDGRFKRETGAGEGILRLFALVNFDSLARRLRLDFSDLYKSGLTYDQVQGQVSFKDGKIYFVEPLLVQSPSSRLQMAGSINLRDETIDTRLIAALPVAGNLTFLAAFATGLPAAAGIYLVSKIFRKQVDQATSVSYSIKGSWDEPRMKFDRLFESESSLRDSVTNPDQKDSDAPPSPPPETLTTPARAETEAAVP